MNVTLQTLRKYATAGATIDNGKNDGNPVFYWFGELLPYSWADDVEGGPDHRGWFTNFDGKTVLATIGTHYGSATLNSVKAV